MIVSHEKLVNGIPLTGPEICSVEKKILISPKEGWEGYVMRVFSLAEQGHTPKHTHPWPHINYITAGKGILHLDGKDYDLEPGSFAYVPANALHQFSNPNGENFSFICIVPEEGEK